MQLSDLPEEILVIIIRKLDIVALENLYNTCKWMRGVLCMHGVLKQCHMSRNILATAHTLKQPFFLNIAPNLISLNMSGVPDLSKTTFMPALRKLKKLRILDISYTHLNLLDLIEIHKTCPSIKDITINFMCGISAIIPNNTLAQCQSVFEHFDNVHFIGSIDNLLKSKLALYLLTNAKLQTLKYSVTESRCICYTVDEELLRQIKVPQLEFFAVYMLNWKYESPLNLNFNTMFPSLSMINPELREYILIFAEDFKPKVYASPKFINFFQDKFNVTVEYYDLALNKYSGNVVHMMWNKETVHFDEQFYNTLAKDLKSYFPYYFLLHSKCHELPAPAKYDWFYTIPLAQVDEKYQDFFRGLVKKRVAAPSYVLNYDVIFKEKDKVALSLDFKYPTNNAIALSSNCDYLSKLTHFSLIGLGRYSSDFFNILFQCCVNLETLNVQAILIAPCASAIARSLPLTRSLKNIRLVDKRIDFKKMFVAFSQVPTLENIYIVDESLLENNDLANPSSVLEKCDYLYSVYIESQMADSTRTRTMQMFNKAKISFNRRHINIMLQKRDDPRPWVYYPFVDIFRLNPLTPF